MMTKVKTQWAVENKKTGKVGRTRESGYRKMALYSTRTDARKALNEGKVFAKSALGRVIKRTVKS